MATIISATSAVLTPQKGLLAARRAHGNGTILLGGGSARSFRRVLSLPPSPSTDSTRGGGKSSVVLERSRTEHPMPTAKSSPRGSGAQSSSRSPTTCSVRRRSPRHPAGLATVLMPPGGCSCTCHCTRRYGPAVRLYLQLYLRLYSHACVLRILATSSGQSGRSHARVLLLHSSRSSHAPPALATTLEVLARALPGGWQPQLVLSRLQCKYCSALVHV